MKIQFYPYDFEYKIKNEKTYVYLYSKLEDGSKICVVHEHQAFFFSEVDDLDPEVFKSITVESAGRVAKFTFWEKVKKEFLGKEKEYWKLTVNYPRAVPLLSRELQLLGVQCYEKSIVFIHRYLRDMGITPMTEVKAEGEFVDYKNMRVPVFLAEQVEQGSKKPLRRWKILAIDIETYATKKEIDPEKNPILMVAVYGVDEKGESFKKVITWKNFSHKLDYLENVSDEVELLKRLYQIIFDYQPDILTGYFSDGFDLPYIKTRADKYQVKFDLGLDRSELKVKSRAGSRGSIAAISGILHIDILTFIKYILGKNLKTDSYSLDSVANELLGHKKHDVNLDELAHIWDNEPEKLEDFCEYNLHDAHLTLNLCTKLLPDVIEFTKIIGLPAFDVIRMSFSKLVENYILKRAISFNVLAPNKPLSDEVSRRMDEQIQGAFVYEPTPGLYEDIIVFDFRSLYPTVITAHNIGPESFRCECCENSKRVPEREDYWFCQKEKKFMPSVLEQLILRRVDLKKLIGEQKEKGEDTKILEARSYALKVLANSFYGYLGFYAARWYCLECAASTTAYARNYIKETIKKAERKGFQVIYADTDSCFLLLGNQQMDQAMAFMNEINFDLPGYMELEFEGHFKRGLFVGIKGSDKGAKKKYALIDDKGELKITGFETVRRNWSPLAKEVQQKVLRLVLSGQRDEALNFVKEIAEVLKKGKISLNKLIIKTQITRELSEYSSIGPHVLVAKILERRGERIFPGMVVEYLISKGSGLVRERAKPVSDVKPGGYDVDYYLNKQLLPAVSSIFAVLGYSEEEILGKSKQVGLGSFI